MAPPTFLNAEADACRNALANWASQAQAKDYKLDERGNRIYLRESARLHVEPLLKAMGLDVLQFTMWRHSAYTPMEPDPPTGLYVIPIQILSGQPQISTKRRQYQVSPGSYIVIMGPFELMPEFDCLFAPDKPNPQNV